MYICIPYYQPSPATSAVRNCSLSLREPSRKDLNSLTLVGANDDAATGSLGSPPYEEIYGASHSLVRGYVYSSCLSFSLTRLRASTSAASKRCLTASCSSIEP